MLRLMRMLHAPSIDVADLNAQPNVLELPSLDTSRGIHGKAGTGQARPETGYLVDVTARTPWCWRRCSDACGLIGTACGTCRRSPARWRGVQGRDAAAAAPAP